MFQNGTVPQLNWLDIPLGNCVLWKRRKRELVSSFVSFLEQIFANVCLEYVKAVVVGLCCFAT